MRFQLRGWISPGGWEPLSVLCDEPMFFRHVFLRRPPDARYSVLQPVARTTVIPSSEFVRYIYAPEFWVVCP